MAATPDLTPTTFTDAQIAAQKAAGIGILNGMTKVADPAVVSALAYLGSIGAPPPSATQDFIEYDPGAPGVTYSAVTWTNPTTGQTFEAEAGIVAMFPNVVTSPLAAIGLLPPSAIRSGTSLAPYQVATLMPQPTAPTSAINYGTSPIGPPILPNTTGIGSDFNGGALDSPTAHPIGSPWNEDGKGPWGNPAGEYVKGARKSLFGPSSSWRRIS